MPECAFLLLKKDTVYMGSLLWRGVHVCDVRA